MAVAASDSNANKTEKDRLPSVNDVIKGESGKSYRLVQILGEGGYGTVFRAYDESRSSYVALKAEKWTKTVLRIELGVLRAAKVSNKHFCTLYDYVSFWTRFNWHLTFFRGKFHRNTCSS